jgi:hypothetical protein
MMKTLVFDFGAPATPLAAALLGDLVWLQRRTFFVNSASGGEKLGKVRLECSEMMKNSDCLWGLA